MGKENFSGLRLGRRYDLKELKGEGASASVYLAKHIHDTSLIAVKLFDPHVTEQADISQEAEVQGRLHHPNIVPFHWYGVGQLEGTANATKEAPHDEYPFIVMDYANNGSVGDHLQRRDLQTQEAVDYLIQASNGVQYAHDHGIVHRDLKPSNILLHHEGDHLDVKISDFGIAVKAHTGNTDFTKQFPRGTSAYAAPEQFDGEAVRASDLYSLGIVAFELLAGRKPFIAETDGGYMKAHLLATPPSFESVRGSRNMTSVLAALESTVLQSLAKNPRERQKSIGDFAEDLKSEYAKATRQQAKEKHVFDVKTNKKTEQTQPANHEDDTLKLIDTGVSQAVHDHEARLAELKMEEKTLLKRIASLTSLSDELSQRVVTLDREAQKSNIQAQPQPEVNHDTEDVLLDAEKSNPMIERAKEILGKDFLGVEAIRKMEERLQSIGSDVEFCIDEIPNFPYTERDLELAKENGEMLVLRTDTMRRDGEELPVTLAEIYDLCKEDPFKKGSPIFDPQNEERTSRSDEYGWFKNNTFAYQPGEIENEWALVKKDSIYDAQSYLHTLKDKGANSIDIRHRSATEVVWDTILYFMNTRRRLLADHYDEGETKNDIGRFVRIGGFSLSGLNISTTGGLYRYRSSNHSFCPTRK